MSARFGPECDDDAQQAQQSQPPAPTPQPGPPGRGGAPLEPLPMPEILKQYQPITAERLKTPLTATGR